VADGRKAREKISARRGARKACFKLGHAQRLAPSASLADKRRRFLTRFSPSRLPSFLAVDRENLRRPGDIETVAGRLARATKIRWLLLMAIMSVTLLSAGCSQNGPVGVYTYSRASEISTPQPGAAEPGVTFILELRANGSYISTPESVIRGYTRAEGDLPSGRGTWQVRDGTVILTSGGHEVARLLVDGLDLIGVNGSHYTRIGWLSSRKTGSSLMLAGDA